MRPTHTHTHTPDSRAGPVGLLLGSGSRARFLSCRPPLGRAAPPREAPAASLGQVRGKREANEQGKAASELPGNLPGRTAQAETKLPDRKWPLRAACEPPLQWLGPARTGWRWLAGALATRALMVRAQPSGQWQRLPERLPVSQSGRLPGWLGLARPGSAWLPHHELTFKSLKPVSHPGGSRFFRSRAA